jgi:hypothetical protein
MLLLLVGFHHYQHDKHERQAPKADCTLMMTPALRLNKLKVISYTLHRVIGDHLKRTLKF